ncbi:high nitrogen upregulated cytochrome P450 monooxygenase 2 [Fomes fomentarius]|nr:high nitrogen upregulated cytochrome P450 monooxygenase 2 [Fomes fomentarius]
MSPDACTGILASAAALLAHQGFRRYETYSIGIHLALLFLPPALVATSNATRVLYCTLFHTLSLAFPIYFATLAFAIVLYRLSPIHPLAHYPGPLGCKISKLWMAVLSQSGGQHRYYKALHEKYGNVVRIGPNELSIREPSAVMALLGPTGVPKGPQGIGRMLTTENLPMIGIEDTRAHLLRRRAWNRAFTSNAVSQYEELVGVRARQLVQRLEEHRGQEVSLQKWMDYFSYDAMCDMTFGGGSELLRDGDHDNVWSILTEGMTAMTFFGHVPWLGIYFGHIPAATKPVKTLLNRCQEFTVQRIRQGSQIRDLFHFLNHEDLPDSQPPPYPRSLATYVKLQEEVDHYYPPGSDIVDTKWHRDMIYLDATINETLRLFPPGVGVLSGNYLLETAESLRALYIPPGTAFWVHAYSLHRDPSSFAPFPEEFWPERWLLSAMADDSAIASKPEGFVHNEDAYLPFSHGPMNCVGKNFAMMEMRLVVCALVQRFRFHLRDGYDLNQYERDFKDYLVASRPELPVIVEVRQ